MLSFWGDMNLLYILFGLSVFLSGCLEMRPLQDTKQDTKANTPEKKEFGGLENIYFYQAQENSSKVFDTANGKLKPNMHLKEVVDHSFLYKQEGHHIKTSLSDKTIEKLIVDGDYAVQLNGNYKISQVDIAGAFAELNGDKRIGRLSIGFSWFRTIISPQKPVESNLAASVSFKGNGPVVAGTMLIVSSFLNVEKAMLLTNDWQSSPGATSGLIIGAVRKKNDKNDLWAMWQASMFAKDSTINAPLIVLKRESTLSLSNAKLVTTRFNLDPGSVSQFRGKSKLEGMLRAEKDSVLLFDESTQNAPKGSANSLDIGSIEGDGIVIVDGKITIQSKWSPGNVEQSRISYQKLIEKQDRFVLVKGTQLLGRASLMSSSDMQDLLGHSPKDVSYFEKFVNDDGKKLALEHDYSQGKLFLRIVDKTKALDKDNCLPDIGAYDKSTYQRLK